MAGALDGQRLPRRVVRLRRCRWRRLSLPEALRAEGTLTRYRNAPYPDGIVLVQLGRTDEAQGTRNMRRVSDESVLDPMASCLERCSPRHGGRYPTPCFRTLPNLCGRGFLTFAAS